MPIVSAGPNVCQKGPGLLHPGVRDGRWRSCCGNNMALLLKARRLSDKPKPIRLAETTYRRQQDRISPIMAHILIVDDDTDSSEPLSLYLESAGHKVTRTPNGREALSVVLSNTPNVILLDLVMPEMDGPSFLEVVRSYLRIQSLPVVVLTGLGDSPMIDRVQSLKVNSVLVKSKAGPDDILKAVEEALIRHPG